MWERTIGSDLYHRFDVKHISLSYIYNSMQGDTNESTLVQMNQNVEHSYVIEITKWSQQGQNNANNWNTNCNNKDV